MSDFIATNETNNFPPPKLAPRFAERLRADKDHIKLVREQEGTEDWSAGIGDYFSPFYTTQEYVMPPRKDISELIGTEQTLYEVMKGLVDRRQQEGRSGPAIFVDFGGMWGATWGRLANKFHEEISSGEVCFVVTNIKLDPSIDRMEDYDREATKAVKVYKSLVHYVQSDASELGNVEIALPTGEKTALSGRIALVHEDNALMHSSIPDQDLPTLAKNLEPRGVLLFSSTSMHSSIPEREALRTEINTAFQIGEKNLAMMGMKKLHIPTRNYKVYSSDPKSKNLFKPN